ncbi:MAG: HAMP domain-containing protein [Lachnospiraceae bacterium]|nr:HAMP domain-containing protein [Lachnospiraceae bacterium]MBQ7260865.1 HAMP domain-containing protein [Lachnospiraceae bacterium]
MKNSIKNQFTLVFGGVMAGMLVVLWIANVAFIGTFYLEKKKAAIIQAYNEIDSQIVDGDITTPEFDSKFLSIASTYNLEIIILDTDTETVKATSKDNNLLARRLIQYVIYGPEDAEELITTNNYKIQRSKDRVVQLEYLELWGFLGDGKMMLIRSPIEGIRESAAISNTLLTYIGVIVVICGMFIVRFVAGRLTRPILELADISEKMTNLDFEAKYQSGGENEIALLGNNINKLSEKLEATISELKSANIGLKRDLEKKTEIDELRKEFLSNVSHELKTPIALIQGYAEGLKDNVNADEESRDFYCDVIMDEAQKMNRLVMSLLELNHLESGNESVEMERFDIVPLIQNCISSVAIMLEQNGIRAYFEQNTPVYVWADEFKVEQIINNYLSNAIHYAKYEKIIRISIELIGDIARISVFNSGDPIPEEALDKLWTKFYKVDKARTREYGGSGIGLSIVKAIMEGFKQEYGVINHENGVEFWFELDAKS